MSEYWIHKGGGVDFADGDVGDYNHIGIVINDLQRKIVDRCEGVFDIGNDRGRSFNFDDYIDWDKFKTALAVAYGNELLEAEKDPKKRESLQDEIENDPEEFFLMPAVKKAGIRGAEWNVAEGRSDARDYAMQRWGWKTYRNGNIDTWRFTQEDLNDIVNGIEEIADQEGWSDKRLNRMSFTITIFSTRKQIHLTYQQLKNPRARKSTGVQPGDQNLISYGTDQASKQVRDIDLQNMHPAYKRPGVNPFGDHTTYKFKTFTEWLIHNSSDGGS